MSVWDCRYQPEKRTYDVAGAINVARDAHENGNYHDVHCWVFTSAGFCRLLERLVAEGLVKYRCDAFYDTEYYEFDLTVIVSPWGRRRDKPFVGHAASIARDLPPAGQPAAPLEPTTDRAPGSSDGYAGYFSRSKPLAT
jgi:hypothetical protein